MSEPTSSQLNSACLSYSHDFGLMDQKAKELVRFQAKQWLHAWKKEGLQFPSKEKGKRVSDDIVTIRESQLARIMAAVEGWERERIEADRPKGGLAAIMGKWPGNETDEEIDDALASMNRVVPGWHDKPNGPGMWLNVCVDIRNSAEGKHWVFDFTDTEDWKAETVKRDEFWYGPIPPVPQQKGTT